MEAHPFDIFVSTVMYVADQGDGQLEHEEIQAILRSTYRVAAHFDLTQREAIRRAMDGSTRYLMDRARMDRHGLKVRFEKAIQEFAAIHPDRKGLRRMYGDILEVAKCDGELEMGEKDILQTIRTSWRL